MTLQKKIFKNASFYKAYHPQLSSHNKELTMFAGFIIKLSLTHFGLKLHRLYLIPTQNNVKKNFTYGNQCYECKVARTREVPVLPNREHIRAKHNVGSHKHCIYLL